MRYRTRKNMKFQFDEETRRIIYYRDDESCIFCRRQYHMENKDPMLYRTKDIMHYINKSQGGLGVPQNGAVGCRYHHMLLDNGSKGLRAEMIEMFKEYLMQQYPDWNEDKLRYKKWDFPTFG